MKAARVLFAIGACLAGCATGPDRLDANVIQPVPVPLPQARVAQLPTPVAVFYSPEFAQPWRDLSELPPGRIGDPHGNSRTDGLAVHLALVGCGSHRQEAPA